MPNPAGWSNRTTCAMWGCYKSTNNTHYCDDCREEENKKRRRRRREWAEEGRCVTCSRVVLEVNERTGDLYKSCKVCRRRVSMKCYGFSTPEINKRLREIGGRPPHPNASPKRKERSE